MSLADELKKLADLKAAGVLTQDEFNVQKQKLLENVSSQPLSKRSTAMDKQSLPTQPPSDSSIKKSGFHSLIPWLIVAGLVLAASFVVTPFQTLYDIESAADRGDAAALSEHIDFPSVRKSIKDQLNESISRGAENLEKEGNPFAALSAELAEPFIEKLVDAMVTPYGLATLLDGRTPKPSGTNNASVETTASSSDWSLLSPSFTSLDRFVVTADSELKMEVSHHPQQLDYQPAQFVFRRRGLKWQLTEIQLPSTASENNDTSSTAQNGDNSDAARQLAKKQLSEDVPKPDLDYEGMDIQRRWSAAINNRDIYQYKKLLAPNIWYYGELVTASYAAEEKRILLDNNPDYSQTTGNINVRSMGADRLKVTFTKTYTVNNISRHAETVLEAERQTNGRWLVVEETDARSAQD